MTIFVLCSNYFKNLDVKKQYRTTTVYTFCVDKNTQQAETDPMPKYASSLVLFIHVIMLKA